MDAGPEEAVLLTGVYGSGKSSVGQEMAYLLEKQRAPYALLDLDFLGWADTGDEGRSVWLSVMLRNVVAVVANYREVGVRYFVLAGAIRSAAELERLRGELSMPLRVVRLTVPMEQIKRRLAPDPTAGRQDDLRVATTWVDESVGVGIEDWTVSNDRPIRDVATDVLAWLGWRATEDA